MCVCLFNALSRRVGALQISIIIIISVFEESVNVHNFSDILLTLAVVSGELCDTALDQCRNEPCYPGVLCQPAGGAFLCGPCPAGLTGDGATCVGKCCVGRGRTPSIAFRHLPPKGPHTPSTGLRHPSFNHCRI